MSKPAKPAAAPAEGAAAPVKNNKLLIIIIALLLVIIAGGAGWFFTRSHAPAAEHAPEAKPEPVVEAKFVPLGEKFTVNLQREEGDQYLQAGITLKILDPLLEEKIKTAMPEIRSKLLFLLSSKKPSELASAEGKRLLIAQIISETDAVLGIAPGAEAHVEPHSGVETAAPAHAAATLPKNSGVVDVLFSDFIIQ